MKEVESENTSETRRPRPGLRRLAQRARYSAAQGARVAWYGAHYAMLRRMSHGVSRPGEPAFQPQTAPPDMKIVREEFFRLFRKDRANVEAGLYLPPEDVRPRQWWRALSSSRRFFQDAPTVDDRRLDRRGVEVRELDEAKDYPIYYRQNFHFQTDGWFSEDSARIYDTQVEVLFTGAADAMRRLALAEISKEVKRSKNSRAQVLDVACGTGRFLRQVLSSYPRLNAVGLDLSPDYCEHARKTLKPWPQTDVVHGQAEAMPIEDNSQDIVVCIYLFHELPPKIRPLVAAEIARVLKPGGLFVFADALQMGDTPALDRMLEYFPEGFHEPYFTSYGKEDLDALFTAPGLRLEHSDQAFLTKVRTYRKG